MSSRHKTELGLSRMLCWRGKLIVSQTALSDHFLPGLCPNFVLERRGGSLFCGANASARTGRGGNSAGQGPSSRWWEHTRSAFAADKRTDGRAGFQPSLAQARGHALGSTELAHSGATATVGTWHRWGRPTFRGQRLRRWEWPRHTCTCGPGAIKCHGGRTPVPTSRWETDRQQRQHLSSSNKETYILHWPVPKLLQPWHGEPCLFTLWKNELPN